MAKMDQVKQQTTASLQYALQQRKFTDIKVSLQPTYIIIPDGGVYKQYDYTIVNINKSINLFETKLKGKVLIYYLCKL